MRSAFTCRARLQAPTDDGQKVRCLTCERRCVLAEGQVGWCRTRQNRDGTLYTLTYGLVSSLSCNPIEKKPLYHFYPGSVALTAGSWSCNLSCPWCQNWDISKRPPSGGEFIPPEDFVARARRRGCRGTSISFNEPTLSLEWSLAVFPLARQAGLYNTFVTNGYMTEAALELLVEAGLDGMNVDVKGDAETVKRHCGADVEVVWRNCRRAKALGVWLEVTTLVIPGVNDDGPRLFKKGHSDGAPSLFKKGHSDGAPSLSKKGHSDGAEGLEGIADRIAGELGPETPWHLSRYHPAYRFDAPPTPVATLERARQIGLRAGLQYVYLGNVPGHPAEHTRCPGCGATLIERGFLRLIRSDVTPQGRCPHCGQEIAGAGWGWTDEPV